MVSLLLSGGPKGFRRCEMDKLGSELKTCMYQFELEGIRRIDIEWI